jgi:hypothetical protein
MSEALNQILERFKSKISYRDQDKAALDVSRCAAAGNLGEREYSEWALISNDPLVIINYIGTFITVQASKLASAPLRPSDDVLNEKVLDMRLNSQFVELYKGTLNDGYAFLGLGLDNGDPIARIIDARSIMFNGDDPTLRDATELVVFEVLPRAADENFISTFPSGYVEFDSTCEKVRTSYYHKSGGSVYLDIYEEGSDEVISTLVPNVDRIPVVRFYGEKYELADKRYHYRGLYYKLAGLAKATALAATKLQIRIASTDDANYMGASDAISNHKNEWKNSGLRTFDATNANGQPIDTPVIPIPHDNDFLIKAVELWKSVTADLLGPIVQSGSEAITREEVLARNEVRDALSNDYLSNMADSASEVYRIINAFTTGSNAKVKVQGGFIESQQRQQRVAEITNLYNLAKDSGLNAQGFILEVVANCNLPLSVKERVGKLLMQDPFASPKVVQLTQQIQQLQQTIQTQQDRITKLQIMASQRVERQAEWVASQERIKRFEIMFKQWQQESKDTQEARMEVLRQLLSAGDIYGAMAMLQAIQQIDTPVLDMPATQQQMTDATADTMGAYNAGAGQAITNMGKPAPPPPLPNMNPNLGGL